MEKIQNILNFEDWRSIHCKGLFEVTDERLFVQIYQNSLTVINGEEAGKRGSKLVKYTVMAPSSMGYNDFFCAFLNYMTGEHGEYSIGKIWDLLNALSYSDDYHPKAEFGPFAVYRYTEKGHTYRPSWYKPTGKSVKTTVEVGEFRAEVVTNKEIKIYRGSELLQSFKLGDTVEQGSYNLVYTGEITDIKEKYIGINGCPLGHEHHTIERFVQRNWDLDLDDIGRRNASWSD